MMNIEKNAAFDLSKQTILITGGGSGIGLGMAECMAVQGAKVILVGRNEKRLKAAAGSIGEQAVYAAHDITNLETNPGFIERMESEHGEITTLVNNAGTHLKKNAEEVTDDEFQTLMQTHVNAAFSLARECGKRMIKRGNGHILFTASMTSFMGMPKVIAYTTAKSAHIGLVRGLAADFSPHGVRVNAIAPGWIHSEMMHKAVNSDPERKAKILSRTPMHDFGDPEDIGWAAVYLCSPAAKFVNGVCLPIDGGAAIGF